jgi:hypothetical protein
MREVADSTPGLDTHKIGRVNSNHSSEDIGRCM